MMSQINLNQSGNGIIRSVIVVVALVAMALLAI